MTRPGQVFTPIIRWVGGKANAVADILPHLPAEIVGTYFEPMCGGAALFWALFSGLRIHKAVLGDINEDLMGFYEVVRTDVDELIRHLEQHAKTARDEAAYYSIRDTDTDLLTEVEAAARFLFLNKTCFNGIYRVNASGKFNVPYGKIRPTFNYAALQQASTALQTIELRVGDYRDVCHDISSDDVCYLDPPYWPRGKSGFTAYDKAPFGPIQQSELARWCRQQTRRGVTVLTSNHDCQDVRALYTGSKFVELSERRAVAASGPSRKAVGSLLIVVSGEEQHGQAELSL